MTLHVHRRVSRKPCVPSPECKRSKSIFKTGIAQVKGDAAMEPLSGDLLVLALEEAGYPARILRPARAPTAHRRSQVC